jgi:hypothetical protein
LETNDKNKSLTLSGRQEKREYKKADQYFRRKHLDSFGGNGDSLSEAGQGIIWSERKGKGNKNRTGKETKNHQRDSQIKKGDQRSRIKAQSY